MSEPLPPADGNGIKSPIESLLFISDGPLSLDDLARVLEVEPVQVEAALKILAQEYAGRGIRLQRGKNTAQLVSAPEAAAVIQKFLGLESSARLSPASLETLAIIAYRQPLTRPQVENIRGVNCDGVVHNLLARNLIYEVGRLDTVGHPIQYGTTPEFLQYFGLESLDEMPPLPDDIAFQSETKEIAEFLRGRERNVEAEEQEREKAGGQTGE